MSATTPQQQQPELPFAPVTATPPLFSFGVLTDVHHTEAPTVGTRHYDKALWKLGQAVQHLNAAEVDFVLQLGDLVDRGFDSFALAVSELRGLQPPVRHVLGNHDFTVPPELLPQVPRVLGLATGYYDIILKHWRLLVLDASDVSLYAHTEGCPRWQEARAVYNRLAAAAAPHAQVWNSALGHAQLDWLDKQLALADRLHERVLIACHLPVWPASPFTLWNAEEVLAVIEPHPSVAAWLSGHHHDGGGTVRHGIQHVTFKGMIETADTTAFATVAVHPDRLVITGIGRELSRVLPVTPKVADGMLYQTAAPPGNGQSANSRVK